VWEIWGDVGEIWGDVWEIWGDVGEIQGEIGEGGEAVEGTLGADEQRGQELLDLGGCRLVRVRERRFRV